MACFAISAGAAVVVAASKYVVRHFEKKAEVKCAASNNEETNTIRKFGSEVKVSKKLGYLELALFAGSFLLLIEHIIHGEIIPYFPFFTAAATELGTQEMLYEMGTVGVTMTLAITFAWGIGVLISDFVRYRKQFKKTSKTQD